MFKDESYNCLYAVVIKIGDEFQYILKWKAVYAHVNDAVNFNHILLPYVIFQKV